MRFLFFAKHGGKRAASAFSTGDWGHTAQAAQKKFVNSFNSLLRRLRPTIKFVVFRPITEGVQNTEKSMRGFWPNSMAIAASLQGAPRGHLAEV